MRFLKIVFVFFIGQCCTAQINLQLNPLFSDNMVLQQGQAIPIKGTAAPSNTVHVNFGNQRVSAFVQQDSSWQAVLEPMPMSTEPTMLKVVCNNKSVVLKNIVVGDVWLCIGQSNMEWPFKYEVHAKEEITASNNKMLRFYNPTYAGKGYYNRFFSDSIQKLLNSNEFFQPTEWSSSDSNTVLDMSAVAYYFGKRIVEVTESPIGLINMSVGGSPIESFISEKELLKDGFGEKVKGLWFENDELPIWIRERGRQNIPESKRQASINGANHPFKPGFIYESGISKITDFPIAGVIWYQGESNAQEYDRVHEYADLQNLLVNSYRSMWNRDLPFYYVQLSSIDSLHYKSQLWPKFRNMQRELQSKIPNSGMAVTSDIGSKTMFIPKIKNQWGNA